MLSFRGELFCELLEKKLFREGLFSIDRKNVEQSLHVAYTHSTSSTSYHTRDILWTERRSTMAHCRRCGHKMLASEHHEEETLGNLLLVKTVSTRECTECGLIVSVTIPTYYQKEIT